MLGRLTDTSALRRQIVFALLGPAATCARRFGFQFDEFHRLSRSAYYEELREAGLTQLKTAKAFGVSPRTVATLALEHRLVLDENSLAIEHEIRLMTALAAGPATAEALQAVLPRVALPDLQQRLRALHAAGCVRLLETANGKVYEMSPGAVTLEGPEIESRLGALRILLGTVRNVVMARFFSPTAPAATARTFALYSTPELMATLADTTVVELRDRCLQADRAAREGDGGQTYTVALIVTPVDHSTR